MSHRQCSSLRVSLLFVANGCIYSPFHLCDRKSVETAREKEEFALANNSSPSWQERCLVYFPDAVLNHCPKVMGGGSRLISAYTFKSQSTIEGRHQELGAGTWGRNHAGILILPLSASLLYSPGWPSLGQCCPLTSIIKITPPTTRLWVQAILQLEFPFSQWH